MESIKEPNNDAISTSTGEHPLLIPEIVEIVVKHLKPSFEQLKTLRLVSKTWTEALLLHWRKSGAVITIVPESPLFDESDYKIGLPVTEFLLEFQDPHSPFQLSNKPFAKYKLKDIRINLSKCIEPNGGGHPFWTLIGPLMKSLHFYKCKFNTPGLNPGESLKQLVVQMIPNLQHLQLTDTLTRVPGRCPKRLRYPTFDELHPIEIEPALHLNLRTLIVYDSLEKNLGVDEILKVTPGLEVIRGVDPSSSSEIYFLSSIFELRFFWNSDHLPRPLSSLKQLDFMDIGVSDSDFPWSSKTPLKEAPDGIQLPLETLAVHLNAFKELGDFVNEFNSFLNSFSSTLKTLKAFRAPVGGRPYFKFLFNCSMTLLTELYLWGTIAPSFEFLRETPNLKKLRIDLGCFEKRDVVLVLLREYNDNGISKRKYQKYHGDMALKVRGDLRDGILCTELKYLEIDFEFPEESLRWMGKWMPNLGTLKTILNERTVPVVCEIWGELSELVCLQGSKIGNGCFVRGDEEVAGFSGEAGPKFKICDLADLERFQLDAYCGEAELTDEVVYNGFLKMKRLKCVEICVNSLMSEKAQEALRKGTQFCRVFRDDQCAGAGLEAREWRKCDRCDFRTINEIYRFVHHNVPIFGDADSDSESFSSSSGDSDTSNDL